MRSGPVVGIVRDESGAIMLRRLVQIGLFFVCIVVAFLPYEYTVSGEFRLRPIAEHGIRTQVSGEIKTVFVAEGQWVKQGDPVAELFAREQERSVEEIQAALDEVNAKLRLLRGGAKSEQIAKSEQEVATAAKSLQYSTLQLKRQEEMYSKKAVSEKEYEEASKVKDLDEENLKLARKNLELVKSGARDEEIDALDAEKRRMEVNLQFARQEVELAILRSPAAGKVITPSPAMSVGQYLNVGDLFAIVEDSGKFVVETEIMEEDIGQVRTGSPLTLKFWAFPTSSFETNVLDIAPVAYEKSKGRVVRALSERELRVEQEKVLRDKGKVVRVLAELPNPDGILKSDMSGYAKIECGKTPLLLAFTRWLVRFFMVEVWSWIP